MRLHEQRGEEEPFDEEDAALERECNALRAEWYRMREEGADWPKVTADGADYGLSCPDCDKMTSDGEYCGECLSERAEYYHPDEGGSN